MSTGSSPTGRETPQTAVKDEKVGVLALLGPRPEDISTSEAEAVLERIIGRKLIYRDWPESLDGMAFLHRAFGRVLQQRGGDVEAGRSIRRDLQRGTIKSVLILQSGEEAPLEPTRWRGSDSYSLYWRGRTTSPRGDVYLLNDTMRRDAELEVQDFSTRERNTARRMILGMAMSRYKYRPGTRGDSVKHIAEDLEARGLEVSESTIRNWLTEAVEEVYEPADDRTRET